MGRLTSHLTSEDLVDLAEGVRDEASVPHLAGCDVCRQQVADLRAMVAAGVLDGVPEPSPLFWDHLSARVREAVRSEELPARASSLWSWSRVAAGAMACALVVAIGAALGSRGGAPAPKSPGLALPSVERPSAESAQIAAPALIGSPDDPSLSLVADYGRTLDWDEMREQMAVSAHSGGLDATVGDLNGEERQELQRLLKEELARPAAPADRS